MSDIKNNAAEIERALRLILTPGQVTELRALEAASSPAVAPKTISGYYDDPAKLAKDAATIAHAKGIYFIPNPVKPALLARSLNKARAIGKEPTTSDGDIERRHWLLIDCDAVRPSGIAASDDEHKAALAKAAAIQSHLTAQGWPAPIVADSGNGGHLLYRIDLPADDGGLVQSCLAALAKQFDDATVTVDTGVFNPARIWKLYGTLAGKGDAAAASIGRPHRLSKVLQAPDAVEVVSRELLEALAGATRAMHQLEQPAPKISSGSFDLDAWIGEHGLDVTGPEPWNGGGRRWIFKRCPWNPDHTNGSAFIAQLPSGAITGGCHHNGCQGKGWRELRTLFDRDYAERQSAFAAVPADDDEPEDTLPDDPGPLPKRLLTVPGFISDVMDFNLAGAHKPQPSLALAGVVALLATLTGHKITDKSDTRTNLYCLAVGGTSIGKDRARIVNKDLLRAAGLKRMLGPESIGSAQGLVNVVEANPAILLQLDEFGRYLKAQNDGKSAFLYNIVTVLLRLFTSSATTYIGDALADTTKIKQIDQPHACLFGTTTPDVLYEALTGDSLTDGFLSRVLIFEATPDVEWRDVDKPVLPKPLVEQAAYWGDYKPTQLTPLSPSPLIVEYAPDARQVIAELHKFATAEERRLGEPLGLLWPRVIEKAKKLALIYAASENAKKPFVTAEAAQWGADVVRHLTQRMVFLASRWLADNRQESNVKRVARIIEAVGTAGITKSALTGKTQWLKIYERDEILATLIQSGQVVLQQIATATRPRQVYVSRKFVATSGLLANL